MSQQSLGAQSPPDLIPRWRRRHMQAAFAAIERAAVEGARCPINGIGEFSSGDVVALAHAGWIAIEIAGRNYRTVEILAGPHAGKRTKEPPAGWRTWKRIDRAGTHIIRESGKMPAARSSAAYREKRRAAMKAVWADPEYREKMRAAMKAAWADPERREKQKAAWADPERRAQFGKAVSAARLGWCPPEFLDDYRRLRRALGAKEARACIERQMARRHGS